MVQPRFRFICNRPRLPLNPKHRSRTLLIHTLKKALTQGPVSLTRHRIDLIRRLVCALIQVRSVNMKKLACSLSGRAQIDSPYRRLQRFFSRGFSPSVFTPLIVSKVVRPDPQPLLVMDRTHGRLGRTDRNVLCVGLVYQGVSIPLAYQSLPKPGNANTSERKCILTKVLAYLDPRSCWRPGIYNTVSTIFRSSKNATGSASLPFSHIKE